MFEAVGRVGCGVVKVFVEGHVTIQEDLVRVVGEHFLDLEPTDALDKELNVVPSKQIGKESFLIDNFHKCAHFVELFTVFVLPSHYPEVPLIEVFYKHAIISDWYGLRKVNYGSESLNLSFWVGKYTLDTMMTGMVSSRSLKGLFSDEDESFFLDDI